MSNHLVEYYFQELRTKRAGVATPGIDAYRQMQATALSPKTPGLNAYENFQSSPQTPKTPGLDAHKDMQGRVDFAASQTISPPLAPTAPPVHVNASPAPSPLPSPSPTPVQPSQVIAKRAFSNNGRPQAPSTWQRLVSSFGHGAILGGVRGAAVGAAIPQVGSLLGADYNNLGKSTAIGAGTGGVIGAVTGGISQIANDEINRRINIEAKRKIIEAERLQQLAGGAPAPAMQAAVAPAAPAGGEMSPGAVLLNAIRPTV